ncbi:MAG: hypothetical protein QOE19_633 [Actinomycetota bacterium]|jgi:hypothetical protein|nr:hypothetical protein [Actinomycetota bacterium]
MAMTSDAPHDVDPVAVDPVWLTRRLAAFLG